MALHDALGRSVPGGRADEIKAKADI